MMAACSTHKASHKLVFSSVGWLKGLLPGSTLQALPTLQRQIVKALPFFHRHFSLSHCLRTAWKPTTFDAVRFRTHIQAGGLLRDIFKTAEVSSRVEVVFGTTAEHRCGFGMTCAPANQHGMGSGGTQQESERVTHRGSGEEDWALRLANENGFLSWCRNSYLTTVVAIAMLAEGTTPLALQAAEAAFLVAGLNLTWGTYQYIYNLLRLRRRTGVSAVGALMYISMALLHISMWFIVCSLFLGYADEPDTKTVKEERRNPAGVEDV